VNLRAREAVLRTEMEPLLSEREIDALVCRIEEFIAVPSYPLLNPHRNIPYGWW
jgi:hypothetical protein